MRKTHTFFGTVAAILVVSGALALLQSLVLRDPLTTKFPDRAMLYLVFVATPGAFLMSILGLFFDKRKWLAVLMTLLSGVWTAFLVLVWICVSNWSW